MMEEKLREALADVSHDIWSHWMRWMFTVGTFNDDGTWTMPAAKVERWQRQMNMSYAALTEMEKDSDREQADKILAVVDFDADRDRWRTYALALRDLVQGALLNASFSGVVTGVEARFDAIEATMTDLPPWPPVTADNAEE